MFTGNTKRKVKGYMKKNPALPEKAFIMHPAILNNAGKRITYPIPSRMSIVQSGLCGIFTCFCFLFVVSVIDERERDIVYVKNKILSVLESWVCLSLFLFVFIIYNYSGS